MESGKKLRRRKDDEIFPLSEQEKETLNLLGHQEIRIDNAVMNDSIRQIGMAKIWNSYSADQIESFARTQNLIPRGFYYSTFDVDTNELVFLAKDKAPIKLVTKIRHKINAWFVKRGW